MRAVYGKCANGDDGIALPFAEGHSYTGEATVEISLHGSVASIRSMIEACVQAGARLAEPGEFTQRAFLNGRLDLSQAEAVRDSIDAQSELQFRNATRLREGVLSRSVNSIRSSILKVLAAMEASVDFSEEIGPFDRKAAHAQIEFAWRAAIDLLRSEKTGQWIRYGLRIAIVGPPNAGKSSLLNAMLRQDRAIVTDVPGTTRDTIEERIEVNGIPVVLTDTAGIRDSLDPIETLGIQRTNLVAQNADVVWYVFDCQIGLTEEDETFASNLGVRTVFVANKSDLCEFSGREVISVSALTGLGMERLNEWIVDTVKPDDFTVLIAPRHAVHLESAAQILNTVCIRLLAETPPDLLSVLLNDAVNELGKITGESADEDMLHRIFRDFCVGK